MVTKIPFVPLQSRGYWWLIICQGLSWEGSELDGQKCILQCSDFGKTPFDFSAWYTADGLFEDEWDEGAIILRYR